MAAQRIDGTAVARRVREDVAKGVEKLVAAGGTAPGLATVLIGDDPASDVTGRYVHHRRPAEVPPAVTDEPAQEALFTYCESLTGEPLH